MSKILGIFMAVLHRGMVFQSSLHNEFAGAVWVVLQIRGDV
ncbi:hypothetical protein HMPREF9098_2273 [Kingella denitrificans ATCC 33394]|uniref:Uncharacterized protein n=1 Tax=Kingella denitrificans ATCC 33394 TaxID=888741 RepID=F0F2D8_9NEIS|nr:hypothetical protein HMPREF9098_2273 [Kingella denitrificans ATCC 33394]